ncbi:C40 family peptidase [Nonomuraea fuscirosea]|uniref:C40 family peptidase n=1 Tax=Nonomuraea fuscirosea TaxID=1291556 RepID=UPI003413E1A8
MILEAGLAKALAAGGGLVSSIALIGGMAGGSQFATATSDPEQLASAVCTYTGKTPKQPTPPNPHQKTVPLTTKQTANARIIITTAQDLGLPPRAAVIALATALQESTLDNNTIGDHGQAFGLFQQHPRHGWGTRVQVSNPRYATRAFLTNLARIDNWADKPLAIVAQAVQRSAFPHAYAKHESRAARLFTTLTGHSAQPEPSPKPAKDDLHLSAEDFQAVRDSLELATSMGVPRATIVADVQEALHVGKLPSAHKGLAPHNTAQRAEHIVTTVATRVCRELSRKIGAVLDPQTLAAIRTSDRGAIALAAALKMIGVPYSWGGGGPKGPSYGIQHGATTKGFDCSGLAEYAWAKAGVKIGGHTSTQWNAGARIPRSHLKPGDLLFFATNPQRPSTIHHVALNIDGKRYIHAPTTGSKVQIGHWTTTREAEYAGAVRPQ